MLQDIRYAFRTLVKSPVITAVAIISLALGIGANTAIFSVMNALVLRSLPVHDPEQLVSIYLTRPERADAKDPLSLAMFEEIRIQQRVFSTMFAWSGGGMSTIEANGAKFAGAVNNVSGDYFAAMGISPLLGRLIQPSDVPLEAGTPASVAVLEYDCWRRNFKSDPNVVGKIMRLEGQPLTVIGVARKGFSGLILDGGGQVTVPLSALNLPGRREREFLTLPLFGRLKPGVSLEQARAQLQTIWPAIRAATLPTNYSGPRADRFLARKLEVESEARGRAFLRGRVTKPLEILMCLVGMVLLIACVNLANLMLARAEGRRHEIAVRAAVGASAWRLIRQLLTESVMLSLSGAALGFLAAIWTSRLLVDAMWTGFDRVGVDAAPDVRVLSLTTGVALLTGIVFGLAPAWRLARTDVAGALRGNSRSVRGTGLFGKTLVSAQVALSMVMVLAAALFIHSLDNMRGRDPGFRRDHTLLIAVMEQPGRSKIPNRVGYYRDLRTRLLALPGVTSVSYSNMGPINYTDFQRPVAADGPTSPPEQSSGDYVGPGFFQLVGMQVLGGRDFSWHDDESTAPVAVISESLAKHLYPNADPLGRKVIVDPGVNQKSRTIIGVVNSASLWKVQTPEPLAIYTPVLQVPESGPYIDIRTIGDPHSIMQAAEKIVEAMGYFYTLRAETLDERSDRMLMQERMTAWLSAFFGGLAMLLASIGLYGLMSYAVTRRTSEIGIRMAVGAERRNIMGMVLREVLLLVAVGIAIGIPTALSASKWIAGMLFGITPSDPKTIAIAAGVLLSVAIFAGYLPARRASRIDPMTALRTE